MGSNWLGKIMTPNLIERAVKLPDCVDGDHRHLI